MITPPSFGFTTQPSRSSAKTAVAGLLLSVTAWLTAPHGVAAQCEPTTCEAEGKDCGWIDDGCGVMLDCGECGEGFLCGGGEIPNVCAVADPGDPEPPEPPPPPVVPPRPRTYDELAARGQELVAADPVLAALREELGSMAGERWGFDLGLGVAEGQTENGPGKQRIGASLTPSQRTGYEVAVGFTVDRNREAVRAALGAEIAAADPHVAQLRNGPQGGVYYRLGFDIASAIFGPRSLGAQGNTAIGPGARGILDGLGSQEARMGFIHSMSMHLARKYPQ